MGEVLKESHIFLKIIISLKYSLFINVDQHLCDTHILVQIGPDISEEILACVWKMMMMLRRTSSKRNLH